MQYVKMSEAFRKIYLHRQALYKEPGDVNIFYEKLRSFQHIEFICPIFI